MVKVIKGASYFLIIVDDKIKVTWTYCCKKEEHVKEIMSNFLARVENHFHHTVKTVRQ